MELPLTLVLPGFVEYHGVPSVCAKDPVCSGELCFRKNLLTA